MPLYEYVCTECQHKQEELIGIHETPIVLCEKCQAPSEKIISRFMFRGSIEDKSVDFKIERAMSRGKELREEAQDQSKMGQRPYEDMVVPDVDIVDQI